MMLSQKFNDPAYFTRGYADKLPNRLVEALREEVELRIEQCVSLDGIALYRAQGAATAIREFVELLEKGVDAPAPDAGISPIT